MYYYVANEAACVGKASGRIYHSSQAQQPRREAYETQWEEHEARRHMHM